MATLAANHSSGRSLLSVNERSACFSDAMAGTGPCTAHVTKPRTIVPAASSSLGMSRTISAARRSPS